MTPNEFANVMSIAGEVWPAYRVSVVIDGETVNRVKSWWDDHRRQLTALDVNTWSEVVMQAMDTRRDGLGNAPPFADLLQRAWEKHNAANADKLDSWRKPVEKCPEELRHVTLGYCSQMMGCGLDAHGYRRRAQLTHWLIKRRAEINWPMSPDELKGHQDDIKHYEAEAERLEPKPKEAVA